MRQPLLCLTAVALGSPAAYAGRAAADHVAEAEGEVSVQVLGVNDFHGHLEPPTGRDGRVGSVPAGGAEYLATHIHRLEQANPNTAVVSAGDLFGNSPLLSALFHDEPTVEAMNEMGLDLNAVGNHEFDEGVAELRRMDVGGCHATDGCRDGDGFGGAEFEFLAANTVEGGGEGETLFPPYAIRRFDGVPVAFIGLTLEGTPRWTGPGAVAGYRFLDEADTVNALVPELQRQGVEAFVVLLHEGGSMHLLDVNGCTGICGPLVDIVRRMTDEVDVVLSGHTHDAYRCVLDGTPVSSAYSYGRLVTDVDLSVDRGTGEVRTVSINNEVVTRDVPRDPAMTSLIDRYRRIAAPLIGRPIGRIAADTTRADDDSLEQSLGDALADAWLGATDEPGEGNADLALVNSGGIRADLGHGGDGVVTYGEVFETQPLLAPLVTMTLTGAQLERVLEEQFCGMNATDAKVLLPSAGFTYTWDRSAPAPRDCAVADRVDPASIRLDGRPVEPGGDYRVTVNSYLAGGGDGHPTLAQGTKRNQGPVDLEALEAHLARAGHGGLVPPPRDRIAVR